MPSATRTAWCHYTMRPQTASVRLTGRTLQEEWSASCDALGLFHSIRKVAMTDAPAFSSGVGNRQGTDRGRNSRTVYAA
ncbi:hypothetical protein AWB67_06254 [Caballeronia terrestris]|uniref:Uncharacterized protein n=1 Tax=Caballeronia terrestris TaxID=1226301 RepID=A0A158KP38_9BURK|nr:hypothetical protein AWB67_06254 [Caballeronia terrestris]